MNDTVPYRQTAPPDEPQEPSWVAARAGDRGENSQGPPELVRISTDDDAIPLPSSDGGAEIAAITGQYGALIANARDGLRSNDLRRREAARGLVLRLMDEQAAALRSAKERQRAAMSNRHSQLERPDSAQRRPPGAMGCANL